MKLIIIGGVAGGASAAARARRLSESAEIILIERGPVVSFANCGLPYHLSGEISDRASLLVQTPESLKARFNLDVRVNTEALTIDRAAKTIRVRQLMTGVEETIAYDKLILSPGAEALRPPIPGLDGPRVHTFQTLADMDAVLARVRAGAQSCAVIGGGFIGLEVAENLAMKGLRVHLIEAAPQVFAPFDGEMATPLHQELVKNKIHLLLNSKLQKIESVAEKLKLFIENQSEPIEADFVVAALGVRPRVQLAKTSGLALGKTGGIAVDKNLLTNDPHIFAVGDAIEVTNGVSEQAALIALAGPANRQGRIAAENALGGSKEYKSTFGSSVCKIFSLTAAAVGLNARALQKSGTPFETITIHPAHHANYYPGAQSMTLKILFSPHTGHLLGAQIVGGDGVDKRLDVLATALQASLTVYDLEELELAYAPPYGSAKDPVNFAGFVAANVLQGEHRIVHAAEVKQHVVTGASPQQQLAAMPWQLIDVRTPQEFSRGSIAGAKSIPVDELRARLSELNKDKPVVVFCQVGVRGYTAQRILSQLGFDVRNLVGGFKSWQMFEATVAL